MRVSTAKNQMEVATAGLDGFTFRLAGHPMVEADRVVSVKVGQHSFYASVQRPRSPFHAQRERGALG